VRELNLSKNRRAAHRQGDKISQRLGKTLSAKRLISSVVKKIECANQMAGRAGAAGAVKISGCG
jgi:hypothetical protein